MSFLTPQGDDCCCNGSGERCDCVAQALECGIKWYCKFPRDDLGIPRLEPNQMRIIEVDVATGDFIAVAYTITDFADGFWQYPDSPGRYQLQVCCNDPGYGECRWVTLTDTVLEVSDADCPLQVGVVMCWDDWNRCDNDTFEVRVYAWAKSENSLTSLLLNGADVLPAGGPYRWVLPALIGENCSGVSCGTDPGTQTPTVAAIENTYIFPDDITEFCVTATDDQDQTAGCCVSTACHWRNNTLRFEVPSNAITSSTASATWTKNSGFTLGQILAQGPGDVCYDFIKENQDLFISNCGFVPDEWAYMYWETITLEEVFTLGSIIGGTYFFEGNSGENDFSPYVCTSAPPPIGTVSHKMIITGRRVRADAVSCYDDGPIQFEIEVTADFEVPFSYTIPPIQLPNGLYVKRAPFAEWNIRRDINTWSGMLANGALCPVDILELGLAPWSNCYSYTPEYFSWDDVPPTLSSPPSDEYLCVVSGIRKLSTENAHHGNQNVLNNGCRPYCEEPCFNTWYRPLQKPASFPAGLIYGMCEAYTLPLTSGGSSRFRMRPPFLFWQCGSTLGPIVLEDTIFTGTMNEWLLF